MTDLPSLWQRLSYYLGYQWNLLKALDLILVAAFFFVLLLLLHRSRAFTPIRGGAILALLLVLITNL